MAKSSRKHPPTPKMSEEEPARNTDERPLTAEEQAAAEKLAALMATAQEPLPPRIVRIAGEIHFENVGPLLDVIHFLENISPEPIRVDITSPGGSIECGFAIHDALRLCQVPVVTMVFGCASSIASVVMQAGDRRLIAPNASVFVHEVRGSFGEEVDYRTMQRIHGNMADHQRRIERFFARCTGQPLRQIRAWCAEERRFTATEAVRFGFADAVVALRPKLKLS